MMSKKTEQYFNVLNMKCSGCVSAVTTALNELDDTEVIEVNIEERQAVVNSSQPALHIADTITASGFPAEPK